MPPAVRNSRTDHTWAYWLAIMGLISVVVALCAGILASAAGVGRAEAAMAGGGAFATSLLLCLAVPPAIRAMKGPR